MIKVFPKFVASFNYILNVIMLYRLMFNELRYFYKEENLDDSPFYAIYEHNFYYVKDT